MNENEVKTAFDEIEPESGAQERMYANILKKAAAQKAAAPEEKTDAPAAENDASATVVSLPVRRPTPIFRTECGFSEKSRSKKRILPERNPEKRFSCQKPNPEQKSTSAASEKALPAESSPGFSRRAAQAEF